MRMQAISLALFVAIPGVANAICDGPPDVSVGRQSAGQLVIHFSNIREPVPSVGGFKRCFTHYNIRWSVPRGAERQFEIGDEGCSPVPSSSCRHFMNADLQKPHRIVMQACRSRALASSRCSAWSAPAFFLPFGPETCANGFVWREAFPNDRVCVPVETRRQAAADNAAAGSRVQPGGGAFGRQTCKSGFVWREADRNGGNTPGNDKVCVPPAVRQQAWNDNAANASRRARS